MADKLQIYNDALGWLGERSLANLQENREPRRVLDQFWTNEVNYCLEQGFWKFAKRVEQLDASTTIIPAFGYQKAVALPTDWIKTYVASSSPNLDPPLTDYKEEAGNIFMNCDPVYLSFISNDPTYGGWNLGKWGRSFTTYVGLRLAKKAGARLLKSAELMARIDKEEEKAKRMAKGIDAMNDPPGFAPRSSWVRARVGQSSGNQGSGSSTGGNVNMGPG